ncbi:MAG: hypothetical protein R3323_07720, partial [Wenzhouxiangellaceae bacterium]|nr:hypothetical protein [Wenzhouxiangellaceae bacterium]
GCTYHGLAMNVDADLEPFSRINPCGYAGQPMTSLAEQVPDLDPSTVPAAFSAGFAEALEVDCRPAPSDDATHGMLAAIR